MVSSFLLLQPLISRDAEMEMKKLHMGTVSYGYESMDEVAHQLALAFGASEALLHGRRQSLATGAQLNTRGRRDMWSRVHDVVLSLALCHNVRARPSSSFRLAQDDSSLLGYAGHE